jgi:Zn-dependent protease
VFYLLGMFVTIIAMTRIVALYKVSFATLLAGKIQKVDVKNIPAEQVELLIQGERFLKTLGFIQQSHVCRGPVLLGQDWGFYGSVYFHEHYNTWALVYVESVQHPVFSSRIEFLTPVDDENYLVTVSGTEFDGVFPREYQIHDAMTVSQQAQWSTHYTLLNEQQAKPPFRTMDLPQALKHFEMLYFQGLLETRAVIPWRSGFRLRIKHGFNVLNRTRAGHKKLLKQKKLTAVEDLTTGSAPAQYSAYQTFKQIQASNKAGWLSGVSFLLISVVLFAVSFGLGFSLSIETLLILIAVLFVHEAGHLFGMWIFGYKDLRMLFIPFMGALASGKKENVTAWQEAVILLLGPFPGFLLGMAILAGMFGDVPGWLIQYGTVSIILNVINLLPFMPLDGGRIVNLALFNRLPRFQLLFTGLSIAALAYAGFVWGEGVALAIAFILAISLPHLRREVELLRHLLQQGAHKAYTGISDMIGVLHPHPQWAKMLPQQRWPLLDSLSYRVQHANTGLLMSLAILAGWVAAWVLPVLILLQDDVRRDFTAAFNLVEAKEQSESTINQLVSDYTNAENDLSKAEAAFDLSLVLSLDNIEQGRVYWNELKNLVSTGEFSASEQGDFYLKMGGSCLYFEENCRPTYLKASLHSIKQSEPLSRTALLAYVQLAQIPSELSDDRIAYLTEAESIVNANKSLSSWAATIHSVRGRLHFARGDISIAENHLVAAADEALNDGYFLSEYQQDLINFYVSQNQSTRSIGLLKQWLAAVAEKEQNWVPIQNDLRYWLVWLLMDNSPVEAKFYLRQLAPNHNVEKIELVLVNLMVDERVGDARSEAAGNEAAKLITNVENDYKWDYLVSFFIMTEDRAQPDEQERAAIPNTLAFDWYEKVARVVSRPEFNAVARAIAQQKEKYHRNISLN